MHAGSVSMRAALIHERGPADAITIENVPIPTIGPTDILVRVSHVAVNPIDTFIRSGRYQTPIPVPFIIGRDLVGIVAAIGEGVTKISVGDSVWANSLGHAGRQGCTAEFAAVAQDRLYRLPAGVDPASAVGVFHPGASAYMALFTHGKMQAGETVYIAGGAGHVGGAGIVLASRAGARVLTSAATADHAYCHSLGAETVFDYKDIDLGDKIRVAAPEGVDVHLDVSGSHDLDAAVSLLAPGGRIILMAGLGARPVFPVGPLYTRDASVLGFAISNANTTSLFDAASRVNDLLMRQQLLPKQIEIMPFTDAAQAHRRIEAGSARGVRLILKI